ncbi:MAG: DUF547 domain-containing protein [Candidatus Wallbacteria bacterium]|nr:DUF547 domain-containing protein [Candidatus Wallbacteria bacterium]
MTRPNFVSLALIGACLATSGLFAGDFDRTHGLYAQVLKAHVRNGLVDYAALKNGRTRLDTYVTALGAVPPQALSTWSRDDRFAYWINAYNAFTLKVIIDHYPIQGSWFSLYPRSSIRQIPGVWDKITFTAAGRPVTLNHIEHEVLRKEFADPRLHAAINCASVSCPELRAEPFLGDRLGAQLDEAARSFATSLARNRIDLSAKVLHASQIFDWFADDFLRAYAPGGNFGGLGGKSAAAASFLAKFGPPQAQAAIAAGGFQVRWLSYDWSLNEAPREGGSGSSR